MSLNQAQLRAVAHKEGPCMVLAGPGSGKTLTIAKRIEYLIKEYKVRPDEILVITFTKLAAKEMKARFNSLINGTSLPVTFGTFHGIYYGILKWTYRMNAGNIFSEEEKSNLLRQIIGQTEFELDIEDERDFLQQIAGEISNLKNNQIDLETYESACCPDGVFREIYTAYEKRRKELRKIDFDDMLVLCYELFKTRPEILAKWQAKFKYILIDEFQDINHVQYEVIRMLGAPEHNLFIVGDDDQSIYRFRGARPEIMLGFQKDYPNAKEILLDVNYRSTKAIVNGALRVIAHNTLRFPKEIVTLNEQGKDVHVQEVRHPLEESTYVLAQVEQLLKDGKSPSDIAVLFRTNTQARTLVETFLEYHVPFQMKEHMPNLYEHFIAKDLMAYMRLASGTRERKDFLAVMNRPKRYIERNSVEGQTVSFETLRNYYCDKHWMMDRIDQLEWDLKMMDQMAPYAAIQYIRKKIGYDEFLKEYAQTRKMNIEELYDVLNEISERAKTFSSVEAWFAHIEAYSKELKETWKQQEADTEVITFLTMHGAKGLEYDTVFIIGANEDIIPYKKAQSEEDIEEERRMFYVAMTRAKKQLTISYTKERNGKDMYPSRFVSELLLTV